MPSAERLRRRMHILERAHSGLVQQNKDTCPPASVADLSVNTEPTFKKDDGSPTMPESPVNLTDDELSEEDTTEESEHDVGPPPRRPSTSRRASKSSPPCSPLDEQLPRRSPYSDLEPAQGRAWYHFDTAVLLALVSPIGNWLTGGEHVANILLVLFLLFYLHQVIEVPWSLYQSSLSRRPAVPHPSHTADPRFRSELRTLELVFLLIALVSPFLGAELIHILLGDSISWFSTTLFVLATGVRPWTHLVDRLSNRVHTLHTQIHYPAKEQVETDALMEEVKELRRTLVDMEKSQQDREDEMCDYVDDCLERATKRQDRRLRDMEVVVMQLHQQQAKRKAASPSHHGHVNGSAHHPTEPRGSSWMAWLALWLPAWIGIWLLPSHPLQQKKSSPPRSPTHVRYAPLGNSSKFPSISTMSSLETIPEDDIVQSSPSHSPTHPSYHNGASPAHQQQRLPSQPKLQRNRSWGGRMCWRMVYIVTFPLRMVLRLG